MIKEGLAIAMGVLLAGSTAVGQTTAKGPVPTELTGITANLTPGSGVDLSIRILNWSTESDRQRVLSVLASVSAEDNAPPDLMKQLADVPSVGQIWTPRPVGYALKYAHRISLPDGGERVVVVTDRPLGSLNPPGPWKAAEGAKVYPFTIVELHLNKDGKGEGKTSLGTPFTMNPGDGTVTLSNYANAPVTVRNIVQLSKPYSANEP